MRSIVLASALTLSTAAAQSPEPPLRDLLRDGLYAEEINRDTEAAARNYEQILSRFDTERPFAVNALYRLAEVRRNQNRKDEAIALYQRVLTTFPDADPQAKLSRERLASFGATAPAGNATTPGAPDPASDEESKELRRLTELAQTSPDRLKPLAEIDRVARAGWIKVSRFLIDRLEGTPKQDCLNIGLSAAAEAGELALCKSLLEQGADPNGMDGGQTLSRAVWSDRVEVVKLLLTKGANPNLMPKFSDDPSENGKTDFEEIGGALHVAAYRGNLPMMKLLLDTGADAALAAPPIGHTPLHLLLRSPSRNNPDAIKLLLEKGAKPDAIASYPSGRSRNEITPLYLAILQGKPETVEQLLKAGATPKGRDYLSVAISSIEKVRLLLDHGADPKLPTAGKSLLEMAATRKGDPEIMRLLLERGAPIDENWKATGFVTENEVARRELLERFSFPEWSAETKIRIIAPSNALSFSTSNNRWSSGASPDTFFPVVADKNQGDSLRSLAELLIRMESNRSSGSRIQSYASATGLTLYRKNPSGGYTTTAIRFDSPDPYPDLRWGDLLWIVPDPEKPSSNNNIWPSETKWALRRHLIVPVEVEIDGRKQALTLRGDRISYDPTKPDCPWINTSYLVSTLTGWDPLLKGKPILVHRPNWPQPIQLSAGSEEAGDFMLQSGDRIVIQTSQDDSEVVRKSRLSEVLITSPGVWFQKRFSATADATPPTLLQAIASTYQGDPKLKAPTSPIDMPKISEWAGGWFSYVFLPHPDLSQIRIRRLTEEGAEQTLTVDLAKAAATCSADTSSDDARKLDTELLPGDIVEIPMIQGKENQAWTGFNEAETRLFVKALSCRVQFSDAQRHTLRDIGFAPPQIIDTGFGLIAVPTGEGSPTLIASNVYDDSGKNYNRQTVLTRGGKSEPKTFGKIFLRDGDRVEIQWNAPEVPGSRIPQPVQPSNQPAVRPPRARVQPPTPVPNQ